MILRCFRCVFFKNVLLAAAASTFLFLDTQTFLCLLPAFSVPHGEVAENVCRQSWVGRCAFRVGWERVASEAVPLSFLCPLKCCLLENELLAAAGSTFFPYVSMIFEGLLLIVSCFFHDFFITFSRFFDDFFMICS